MSQPESSKRLPRGVLLVTPECLRRMALPEADGGNKATRGKDKRGRVLVVGGAP